MRISRPDQVALILVVLAYGALVGDGLGDPARSSAGSWAGGLVAAAAVTLIAISVHAVNEFADAETDGRTVRTRFSGGSGALSAHALPASFALRLALAAGISAILVVLGGLVLDVVTLEVAALLLVGLVGGWQYSVRPLDVRSRCLGTDGARWPMRCSGASSCR